MRQVINDGIASEAMTTFTSGAFLTALALRLGASNFQIGLVAALPTFTNILQLISIYLVQRYNNRRAVVVISNFLARPPLFIIGILPLLFSTGTSIQVLIFLLFFHYAFGSIAGPSWNAWMKDLIPQGELGSYFSHCSRIMQILNVVISLVLAMVLDFVKVHHPAFEVPAYASMFLLGGIAGMLGVWFMGTARLFLAQTTVGCKGRR